MSYIVEQKIKGKIYLYKASSYWDKDKKQPRQKRIYIGPKNKENKSNIKAKSSDLITKNFGNIFLVKFLSNRLGITEILESIFPDNYFEILALA